MLLSALLRAGDSAKASMQRINGRIAMMAFLLISLGELSSGRSVTQQLSVHPIWTTFFAATLSVASLMPKLVSGTSLDTLQVRT